MWKTPGDPGEFADPVPVVPGQILGRHSRDGGSPFSGAPDSALLRKSTDRSAQARGPWPRAFGKCLRLGFCRVADVDTFPTNNGPPFSGVLPTRRASTAGLVPHDRPGGFHRHDCGSADSPGVTMDSKHLPSSSGTRTNCPLAPSTKSSTPVRKAGVAGDARAGLSWLVVAVGHGELI